jgi:hypothetical protein
MDEAEPQQASPPPPVVHIRPQLLTPTTAGRIFFAHGTGNSKGKEVTASAPRIWWALDLGCIQTNWDLGWRMSPPHLTVGTVKVDRVTNIKSLAQ